MVAQTLGDHGASLCSDGYHRATPWSDEDGETASEPMGERKGEREKEREGERENVEPASAASENERARVVFGRWATKARGWPVRVDLSEDKGEGESIHQHGVCPPFGRWAGGRSIRSIVGGGSYQDLKLPPTLSCLG